MKLGCVVVVGCAWATAAAAAPARADAERDFDAKIRAELEAMAPAVLPAWDDANAARLRNDPAAAAEGYRRVIAAAPAFDSAHRRLCSVLRQQHEEAVRECREAMRLRDGATNGTVLALTLAEGAPPEKDEAKRLASSYVARTDSAVELETIGEIALKLDDAGLLAAVTPRLLQADPGGLIANYFGFIDAAGHERWGEARTRLDRAHAAGLPDAPYADASRKLDEATPRLPGLLGLLAWAVAAWFGLFALVLAAGFVLSRAALASAARPPTDVNENATPGEHRLRAIYAAVLWLASAFFYVSIPLLLLVVLAAAGGLLYAIFALGHIPVKLVILIVIAAGVTIFAVVKSLFARGTDEDPGSLLAAGTQPRLRELLGRVAARIGTRPVDNVYLTPGTDLAVMERPKRRERCLIVGVGILDGMGLAELQSVLGHEYGHFKNADTAGGVHALAVRRSLIAMARGLAEGGAAVWWNPAWWFVRGFWAAFLRVSHGATRLQEILADRWAVAAYGSAAFERGLTHVVTRSVWFDHHANATVREALEQQVPVGNFYRHEPKGRPADADIDKEAAASLARPPSAYDSHPPPEQRIRWVKALAVPAPADEPTGMAWDLFDDREEMERSMTAEIRANVRRRTGMSMPASPPATDAG
jgi:Zn-dependent protease with chaperone function